MKFRTEVVHDEFKVMEYKISSVYSQDFSEWQPRDRKIQNRLSAYPQKLTTGPSHFQKVFYAILFYINVKMKF